MISGLVILVQLQHNGPARNTAAAGPVAQSAELLTDVLATTPYFSHPVIYALRKKARPCPKIDAVLIMMLLSAEKETPGPAAGLRVLRPYSHTPTPSPSLPPSFLQRA